MCIVTACYFIISSYVSAAPASAATDKTLSEIKIDIDELKRDAARNRDDISIIRRDEINYKTEKEAIQYNFSSNMSMIGMSISISSAIIGLFFFILGYLGFKSVSDVKDKYDIELGKMRELKILFESEIKRIENNQSNIDISLKNHTKKIALFEAAEKANHHMIQNNFRWALEHINSGLDLDPENLPLLHLKASCQSRLSKYFDALEIHKKIFSLEKEPGAAFNLMETFLVCDKPNEYEKLAKDFEKELKEEYDGVLIEYLNFFYLIRKNEILTAKENLKKYVENCTQESSAKLGTWMPHDINELARSLNDTKLQELSNKTIGFFYGTVTKKDLLDYLRMR